MSMRAHGMLAGVVVLMATALSTPASALTMQECSVKYKAAQAAGTLKGMKWSDFRKAQCASDASAGSATTTAAAGSIKVGNAVFPTTVSPKYAKESVGKARMHTCLDQYRVNKASNSNGDLTWIAKGGGYYSECNKRLGGG